MKPFIVVTALLLGNAVYAQGPPAPPPPPPPPNVPSAPSREWEELVAQLEVRMEELGERIGRAFDHAFDDAFDQNPNPNPNPRGRDRDDQRGPEVTERLSRTMRLGRNGTFELTNVAGDVVITGGGGNDVRLEALKRVRSRDDADGKARLQEMQIEIDEAPTRIDVRTMYPRQSRGFSGRVDYTVALPQDTSVTVRTVSGDLRVTNVRGALHAESVSGDIVAADVPKLTTLKSVSGDVQLTNGGSDGPFDVGTVSGDLVIKGLKARILDVATVSGDIVLDNVESERVETKSVSGSVDYRGPIARNGRYEFNSHSGDIRLTVPGNPGFSVEANTFSGDVQSDFAVTLRGGDTGGRGPRRRTIRGSFGDGSATLQMNSFSGDIAIIRR